jgi:hypothetical protein
VKSKSPQEKKKTQLLVADPFLEENTGTTTKMTSFKNKFRVTEKQLSFKIESKINLQNTYKLQIA